MADNPAAVLKTLVDTFAQTQKQFLDPVSHPDVGWDDVIKARRNIEQALALNPGLSKAKQHEGDK